MEMLLHQVDELSSEETEALRALSEAVYPPDSTDPWPGQSIEWAEAQWCVICWDDDQALSHVGLVLRDGLHDERQVRIGGIGGVKTHPHFRRQGLASQAMKQGVEFFSEHQVDFGLLVCENDLIPVYEKLGWQTHRGSLLVTQHNVKGEFTFNLPMTHTVGIDGPREGVIDLQGPPW